MDLEQIVQQILLTRRDLSRDDVLKKIYEKKRSAEDYFLDDVAARLVASELGIEIPNEEETFQTDISIKDLVSGLNDVTITGRVIIVYPVQTFARSDLTEGKVARLLLADKTGSLRVVLWDDRINMVETGKIQQTQVLRVLHGYVREGIDGKLELHLGRKGDLEISPSDIAKNDYPQIADFIIKIGKLTSKKKRANVLGMVQYGFPPSEFQRQNGTVGKVRRLRLMDDTGEITLVLWNEKVDESAEVEKGSRLRVMNARMKKTPDGMLELHADKATQIESVNEQEIPLSFARYKLVKINQLTPNMNDVAVLARVCKVEEVREFKRSSGETGRVATLHLIDERGTIQLNLWDDETQKTKQIHVGDAVLLEHAYTRQRFKNTQLNLGARGSLTINPSLIEKQSLPACKEIAAEVGKWKIANIHSVGGPFTIEATVASQPNTREVTTFKNEKVSVTSFDITDGISKIRVNLWRNQAEQAKVLTIGTRIKLTDIYAKRGFSNLLELVSRKATTLEIVSATEVVT